MFERLGGKQAGVAARGFLCAEVPDRDALREFISRFTHRKLRANAIRQVIFQPSIDGR